MQEDFASTVDGVGAAIQSAIEGKAAVVRLILTVLLAEGNVLIEDVPGWARRCSPRRWRGRRRIDRDLHDGALQRLVALAFLLQSAQAMPPPGLTECKAELGQVVAGLTNMLEELREYTRGIHPATLDEGGLAAALKTLARRSRVPVEHDVQTGTRLPKRTEVTAYCLVPEALANEAKHAKASAVRVAVDAVVEVVRVSVCDDAVGGADPAHGLVLARLKDHVAAVGGTLTAHSHPGQGARVVAELPGRPCEPVSHVPCDSGKG
jgi:signal transduction histidine kinase